MSAAAGAQRVKHNLCSPCTFVVPYGPWWTAPSRRSLSHASATHLRLMPTSLGRAFTSSFRMRMRYWVILVKRCLFLCTKNLGQYCRCSLICSNAAA